MSTFQKSKCSIISTKSNPKAVLYLSIALSFPGFFLLNSNYASAQIEWKDRPITHSPLDQTKPSIAQPTNSDMTVTVWESEQANGQHLVFAQKIDNVHGLAKWAPDGISVSPGQEGMQTNPRAAYDSIGGVIVTWEDTRNDVTNGRKSVFVQRILLSTGELDPQWPAGGIVLSDPAYNAERPRISGTTFGAYVVWTDWRNNISGGSQVNRDVYIHQINSNASFPEYAWNLPVNRYGIAVPAALSSDQFNAEIVRDNMWRTNAVTMQILTGVTVVFQDDRQICPRTGSNISNVYASSITCDGSFAYQDLQVAPTPGIEAQINPRIVSTYPTPITPIPSAVITWEDEKTNPGSNAYELWAQRIDGNGNPLWSTRQQSDGMLISGYQMQHNNHVMDIWTREIPPSVYEPYILIGWEVVGTDKDVYVALLDVLQGSIVSPNGVAGEAICALPLDQSEIAIDHIDDILGSQRMIVAWKHESVLNNNISYQSISIPGWTFNEPTGGRLITEVKDDQSAPQVSKDVVVYEDARRNPIQGDSQHDINIYCQKPGICVSTKGMDWCEMFPKWTPGTNASHKKHVVNESTGSVFVVWDEIRNGTNSVFIQKYDNTGVPRWCNNGLKINDQNQDGIYPDVAIDDADGAQVVYQTSPNGSPEIYYAHIASIGEVDYRGPVLSRSLYSGESFERPVCAENFAHPNGRASHGVFVASQHVLNGATDRAQGFATIDGSSHDLTPFVNKNNGIQLHLDLKIVDAKDGSCYLMSHGVAGGLEKVNVTFCEEDPLNHGTYITQTYLNQNESMEMSAFGGYDMAIDPFPPVVGTAHQLNVVVSAGDGGNAFDIMAAKYDARHMFIPPGYDYITNSALGHISTQPVLASDHFEYYPVPNAHFDGIIVAWDDAFPFMGQVIHTVKTCRAIWYVMSPSTWPPAPLSSPSFILASDLLYRTQPSISYSKSTTPDSPEGYIVWQGFSNTCDPNRTMETMGAYVVYASPPPIIPGNQWGTPFVQTNMRIDPGLGNYTQTEPVLAKVGEEAVVFWYDQRSGDTCIAGTRILDSDGSLEWRKPLVHEHVGANSINGFVQVYPNPLMLSTGDRVQIAFTVPEAETVTITVHNILGQEICKFSDIAASHGQNGISLMPRQWKEDTLPGLYLCTVHCKSGAFSTPFMIIN